MLGRLKRLALPAIQRLGGFHLASISNWRRQRVLILCYHGLSLKDEHRWYPGLFIRPELFAARMDALERQCCSVLPLQDAVRRLFTGDLPPKSVAITFDDGFQDFHEIAFPILKHHGYPATVYQTTYYTDHPFPVFNLMLDYLFWQAPAQTLDGRIVGLDQSFNLNDRTNTVDSLVRHSFRMNYSAAEKDAIVSRVAETLGIDYEDIRRRRILQLMSGTQLKEISTGGISVELHTHRHRTPEDERLFVREIRDNREAIHRYTGGIATHFCFPSGVRREMFLPWLRREGVVSATTCEMALASPSDDRLLLPRLLDSTGISQCEFEGWLSGFCEWLPRRSTGAPQNSQIYLEAVAHNPNRA